MSETQQFKTESKRLLDLMVNSIYTNREIFIRELISNASDAIDKYHLLSLGDEKLLKRDDYAIELSIDKKNRTLTIKDNGIGMTHDELVNNLGTIAASGSRDFLAKLSDEKLKKDAEIIGQFGVGFYSAYMVAKNVVVETKSPYSDKAYRFASEGTETYTIDEIEKNDVGTVITLYFRDNKEEDNYDEFLETYTIQNLVKKYSDYIRYPIKMLMDNYQQKKDINGNPIQKLDKDNKPIEGEFEYETVLEMKTLNSMIPLWKKAKMDVTDADLNEFYKSKFNDYQDPMKSIYYNTEGILTYNAILYIPSHAPYDLYSEKYVKGLQLYTKGVFIMDACKELLPDYLRFVKGLVDSSDLSLNISREILQQNRQLTKIAASIEKKVLSELEKMRNADFDKYLEFFKIYGINLKYGIYDNFGAKKDSLKDLIIYNSINSEKMLTLKQYVEQMKDKQEFIYYASAKTKDAVKVMPQMDKIKKAGYDVLVLSDDIDEFVMMVLSEYDGKKFKSINQGDLDILSEEEKKSYESLKEEKKTLLEKLKEVLKGDVSDVVLSKRLTDSAVCLVSGDGVSFEMEKVINNLPSDEKATATRILEINPNHDLFKAIEKVYDKNPEALNEYASLLYSQALLIEGLPLKNPVEFSNTMCKLMIENANK